MTPTPPDKDEPKTVPKPYHDMRMSQLEAALSEYREFFDLLVKLLDKHGINARSFHDEV